MSPKLRIPRTCFTQGRFASRLRMLILVLENNLSKIISPLNFYVLIKSYLHLKDVVCNVVDDLCVCQRLKDVNAKVDDVEEHVGDALLVVPALDCHAWFDVWEV